jgi:hypothetical protein
MWQHIFNSGPNLNLQVTQQRSHAIIIVGQKCTGQALSDFLFYRGSSLCPSKSALQVSLGALKPQLLSPSFWPEPGQPYLYPHPFCHPDHCHPNVLWTLNDCKNDPSITTSDVNKFHPSMRLAMQHEDRMHISDKEWKMIHQSVTIIAHSILGPLNPQGVLTAAGVTVLVGRSLTQRL